jgi:hypothetical protein
MGKYETSLAYVFELVIKQDNRAASRNMMNREFDIVVIDEATQALEAECWIALLKAKKAILVCILLSEMSWCINLDLVY